MDEKKERMSLDMAEEGADGVRMVEGSGDGDLVVIGELSMQKG